MNKAIKINDKYIGEGYPCYIIAEMSANHAGSIDNAIEIIHKAKEAGADCIKIQTYTADTITLDSRKEYFVIRGGTWSGYNLHDLYKQAFTPWEWQAKLKEEADKVGIDFFSSPFDKTAVDFLEGIGIGFYKVASFELIDIPLIKHIASKGKPIIMSTGMGSLGEIEDAVNAAKSQRNDNIVLLKCSSAYPVIPADMNLATIKNLSDIFDVPVGLSDHSMGSIAAVTAVALGAKVIEKHFCISREIENPDATFSMEPNEFKRMVEDVRTTERAIGKIGYGPSDAEKLMTPFRKSIWVAQNIKKGEKFNQDNIRVVRPGQGLAPKFFDDIIGKTAVVDIEEATPLAWNMISTD